MRFCGPIRLAANLTVLSDVGCTHVYTAVHVYDTHYLCVRQWNAALELRFGTRRQRQMCATSKCRSAGQEKITPYCVRAVKCACVCAAVQWLRQRRPKQCACAVYFAHDRATRCGFNGHQLATLYSIFDSPSIANTKCRVYGCDYN